MELKWIRLEEQPLPADAECVALATSSKCRTGELCDKPKIQVFRRPPQGWSKIIGWELFCVVPPELYWLTRVNA